MVVVVFVGVVVGQQDGQGVNGLPVVVGAQWCQAARQQP